MLFLIYKIPAKIECSKVDHLLSSLVRKDYTSESPLNSPKNWYASVISMLFCLLCQGNLRGEVQHQLKVIDIDGSSKLVEIVRILKQDYLAIFSGRLDLA